MLAVGLMAMLVVIAQAPQVHAAPAIANASCTSTYWQFNAEQIVNSVVGGYKWDDQLYMLRDVSSNAYCGKVYTAVGLIVPPNGPSWVRVYNEYYSQGNWVGTTNSYFSGIPKCCTSGPYWVYSTIHSASSGTRVDVVGQAQNEQGTWIANAHSAQFFI